MPIHSWSGAEKIFFKGCVVNSYTFAEMTERDGCIIAVGDITISITEIKKKKHRQQTTSWWATTAIVNKSISPNWLIWKNSQKERFCAGPVHDALCMFIREELSLHVRGEVTGPEYPSTKLAVEHPESKTLPACICDKLFQSNLQNPFDSEMEKLRHLYKIVNGDRCVTCSCGARWWLRSPQKQLWSPVTDNAAWSTIIMNDGVPSKPLAQLISGDVYLLSTLRDRKVSPDHFVIIYN